jgi:hypothetical protein
MDGIHHASLNTKSIVEYLRGRSQAVGRAGSVRDNVVRARIIHLFIDSKHKGNVFAFGRSRDNDFFRATLQMCCCFAGIRKEAGRLEDKSYT